MNQSFQTKEQFDTIIAQCQAVFMAKLKDYGSSWRILRTSSITDQVYIKAQRIRSIDEKGFQKINEGIRPEFIGIINYSVIALIQLEMAQDDNLNLEAEKALSLYQQFTTAARDLMMNKNHDYGEAWRNMRLSSLTDIILMKLMRIKQIEDNLGKTSISEGVDANYLDIINYAVFAFIKMDDDPA